MQRHQQSQVAPVTGVQQNGHALATHRTDNQLWQERTPLGGKISRHLSERVLNFARKAMRTDLAYKRERIT